MSPLYTFPNILCLIIVIQQGDKIKRDFQFFDTDSAPGGPDPGSGGRDPPKRREKADGTSGKK